MNQYRKPTTKTFYESLDMIIDFATLGEYRVITQSVPRTVAADDVWATDIEWSTPSERSRDECRLPRARDRKLARERISA
ncbi:MAG: hypothetical protein ACRDKI_09040 [Solirubrobacterales bacterium]